MVGYGRVVGGDYLNATVSARVGSTLVLQAGFKFRKLVPENVAEWDEVVSDGKGNLFSAVGKAVTGAVLPGQLGKAASAALGATLDSMGPAHVINVAWSDGKRSLIKLPDSMFKHLGLVLRAQRAEPVEPVPGAGSELASLPVEKPTVTDQAFSLVSGIIKDRFPARATPPQTPAEPLQQAQFDVVEQLKKLASLRDDGILTEQEFTAKKADLLARL